ncbi:NAD-dependent deacetylase sirtuin-2 [Aaosphaeria arxii CBS 175.79]|uniref:NAD-dependent deacetylase sirtuin-2 n=1 Tax=Aaosphaeria arxii CBS 175.79 TaxID=1450172 RepID=A0A6A5XG97_9PLEO|nr:NAD-dependent deacetylase sirtuin-2 [Aaosphaeria arxii CBS 175.79]KAF2011879.1 NAD-dependent deacetylase sirtuin-2 [Aaosphaeria arxii CBS 175.79]
MGQEQSAPEVDPSTPPRTLSSRTIEAVAELITSGKARKIVVMTGAGISTSAGIPDFRSPDTGLYANLARLDLPFAEAVFDINFFRKSPEPFYTLAQELYPGRYRPTVTHSFIRLLWEKGLLLKLFTQNIDCLEREAGVPDEVIVEAHGSFARQSCIECKTAYPKDLMTRAISSKSVPRCGSRNCPNASTGGGLVKPEIVFFGEALPSSFFDNKHLPSEADLCIVMGTSLSVQPFASLPQWCAEGTPRVLINQEAVGGLGSRADDVVVLGDCDGGVRKLAEALGWGEELEALWAETDEEGKGGKAEKEERKKTRDEVLQDEVDKLTREVEESLRLRDRQVEWLEGHVDERIARKRDDEDKTEDTAAAADPAPAVTDAPTPSAAAHTTTLTPTSTTTPTVDGSSNGTSLSHVFPHLSSTSSSSSTSAPKKPSSSL